MLSLQHLPRQVDRLHSTRRPRLEWTANFYGSILFNIHKLQFSTMEESSNSTSRIYKSPVEFYTCRVVDRNTDMFRRRRQRGVWWFKVQTPSPLPIGCLDMNICCNGYAVFLTFGRKGPWKCDYQSMTLIFAYYTVCGVASLLILKLKKKKTGRQWTTW